MILSASAGLSADLAPGLSAPPEQGRPADQPAPEDFWTRALRLAGPAAVQGAACCKRCNKGKACGNSCISKNKACNVGPGCAC